MSINSISAATSYYSFSSNSSEDELIKKKLIALGIAPTGNSSVDKSLLQRAEKAQSSNESKSVSASKPQKSQMAGSPPPIPSEWQSLMNQLGITPTGDLDKDYKKAITEVKLRIANAKTEPEKDKYRSLQTQIDNFVANNQNSTASAATAMVGASMLSEMNKISLLKQ